VPGILRYASAQPLDFLDLSRNCSFWAWELRSPHPEFRDGNQLDAEALAPGHEAARTNARWLLGHRIPTDDPGGNPATTVVDLVDSIDREGH